MNTFEVGRLGEQIAERFERLRLTVDENSNLVRNVSDDARLGYDLESLDTAELPRRPRFIEVKVLNSQGEFIITSNELNVLRTLGPCSWIYLVDLSRSMVVSQIQDPGKEGTLLLQPYSFRAIALRKGQISKE